MAQVEGNTRLFTSDSRVTLEATRKYGMGQELSVRRFKGLKAVEVVVCLSYVMFSLPLRKDSVADSLYARLGLLASEGV
jgi:hypothetical protein